MKQILAIAMLCLVTLAFGQERRNGVGLNRFIPNNISSGIKFQANYYSPVYRAVASDAITHTFYSKDDVGGSIGIYVRMDSEGHFCFQPEFNLTYRSGSSTGIQTFVTDTFLVVVRERMSNYSAVTVEMPFNFKWRWELTALRKGHWKPGSAFGFYAGPRLSLAGFSRQYISKATQTTIYEQTSKSFEEEALFEDIKYSPIASIGIGGGIDFEHHSGLILSASYYRGLTTHSRKINGYKSLDNRFELGIGIRFQ